jgi:hypothetical protein
MASGIYGVHDRSNPACGSSETHAMTEGGGTVVGQGPPPPPPQNKKKKIIS